MILDLVRVNYNVVQIHVTGLPLIIDENKVQRTLKSGGGVG